MKNLVNKKISEAGFRYLTEIIASKNISYIKQFTLEMQEYLLDENKNVKVTQFMSKARSMAFGYENAKEMEVSGFDLYWLWGNWGRITKVKWLQ